MNLKSKNKFQNLFQIEKLKQESENASKTIERLQLQLQQQSDYNLLKREIQ
jgi:hypothetical protein